MPRKADSNKRAAAANESQAKKAKTTQVPALPKSNRYSAVSASKNADQDFRLAVQDVARANSYICICTPRFNSLDEDDEEEDDSEDDSEDNEDEDEEAALKAATDGNKPKCDGGKKCPCQKPASELPDHRWIVTYAGFRKWIAQDSMAAVRNPDFFNMYTYNDHMAYGILECVQNLFLDWDEAETWQEQWAVCEGLILFVSGPEGASFAMIDDGEQAGEVAQLIGRLFLTMLARLEARGLLTEPSEVKNLGLLMALHIKFALDMRPCGMLEGDDEETNTRPSRFTWNPDYFENYINAYATRVGITLYGLANMADLAAELDTDVSLPTAEDSWGWAAAFKSYQKRYGASMGWGGRSSNKIGGDALDITTWSSAERKKANFDKKDPLNKTILDAIKAGEVISIG